MDVLVARDVIVLLDDQTRPAKRKWHICICPLRRLFLRINTEPMWQPNHPLSALDNTFLYWDSYVELNELFCFGTSIIRAALRDPRNPLGHLTYDSARSIAFAAMKAPPLSDEWRDTIWEGLVGEDPF